LNQRRNKRLWADTRHNLTARVNRKVGGAPVIPAKAAQPPRAGTQIHQR
jgi:hypothetical protein